MTDGFLDAMIEHVPSWGYAFLLVGALTVSMLLAGMGMRMGEALVRRVRR